MSCFSASACGALELPLGVDRLRLGLLEVALGGGVVGARLLDGRFEKLGVDLRDDVALLHRRVEVDEDLRDAARNLAAHLHGDHGRKRAGSRDLGDDAPLIDLDRLVLHGRLLAGTRRDEYPNANGDHDEGANEPDSSGFHIGRASAPKAPPFGYSASLPGESSRCALPSQFLNTACPESPCEVSCAGEPCPRPSRCHSRAFTRRAAAIDRAVARRVRVRGRRARRRCVRATARARGAPRAPVVFGKLGPSSTGPCRAPADSMR